MLNKSFFLLRNVFYIKKKKKKTVNLTRQQTILSDFVSHLLIKERLVYLQPRRVKLSRLKMEKNSY